MLIPPKYVLTPKISQFLSSIEASREIIDSITIPPEIENNIRRQSTLKSSLYSARIEGNELTLDSMEKTPSKTQQKIEVYNVLKTLNQVEIKKGKDLTETDILNLHKIVMAGLTEKENLGKFRKESSATFNRAGIAVYLHPTPGRIKGMVKRLIRYINSSKEPQIPVKACLSHYCFEKIHPFLDGNGRVGRLTLQKNLYQRGYGMKGLPALEEYIDNHRNQYYRSLEEPERDVTGYLEFMLEAIAETAKEAKELVLKKKKAGITDFLLPRRAEIYNIIKEHKMINFDMIRRRFLSVNERTLRYDLKKLQDEELIKKRGATRGVYYEIGKEN